MPKSTNPMIRIHNAETDEVIDREMTIEELAEHEAIKAINLEVKAETKAKESARAAILDRLGLTAEEAALLIS